MKIRRIMTPEHPTDPNDEGSFEKELEENIKWFRGEGMDVSDIDTTLSNVYNVEDDTIKVKI